MALLTTQQVLPTGTGVTLAAANAGGDTMQPGATSFLRVNNASGASITVTIDSAAPCSFGFDHDLAVAVPAGAARDIGPLPASRFARSSDGLVGITYSGVTSLTVAAVSL
jgi:hypothetical protein